MGYQALLYCPEEKTARTLTQVLSDLEFSVEACTEPFAAVKKLMGGHFDAVVVDCDNEQNATLLFKSARNSASNQASLAVAVVEGQAGVAKAFRIGANLVLTRPINVEQAKGTLRVARGLLRKGDSPKPAASPTAPLAPRSSAPPAPKAPTVPATMATARPSVLPSANQNPFAESAGTAEKRVAAPAAQTTKPSVPPSTLIEAVSAAKMASAAKPANFGGGAATAPAPARDILEIPVSHRPLSSAGEDDNILEVASGEQSGAAAGAQVPAPSFSFGGANAPAEAASGSKKVILAVAAVVLVGVLAYAGWAHFAHSTSSLGTSTPTGSPAPAASTTPVSQPKNTQPAPAPENPSASLSTPSTSSSTTLSAPGVKPGAQPPAATPAAATPSSHAAPASDDEDVETASSAKPSGEVGSKGSAGAKPDETPLVVKSGTVPKIKAKAAPGAADAPAPSVIGMADPASSDSLSNLVDSGSGPKPVLQKMNVSQGVSTGLLVKKVDPVYPPNAVRMRIEGSVLLDATISKTGNITDVKVVNGDPQLARAASDAVKKWKYAPYLLNGEPVEIQTQITIKFKLPN